MPPPVPLPAGIAFSRFADPNVGGLGGGTGKGQGDAKGEGNLLGNGVGPGSVIAVVMDQSGSMTTFNRIIQNYLHTNYGEAKFYGARSAIGGAQHAEAGEEGPLGPALGANDLYDTVYIALAEKTPDAVVLVSDFEDGYVPEATTALISALRQHNIKLMVLTRELGAYPGLAEYCRESGGTYSLLKVKEPDVIDNVHSYPQIQTVPPLALIGPLMHLVLRGDEIFSAPSNIPAYGDAGLPFVATQLSACLDPGKLKQPPRHADPLAEHDKFLRQMLIFCVTHPQPDATRLLAEFVEALKHEILAGNPDNNGFHSLAKTKLIPPDAWACHAAQQVIAVALVTQNKCLLESLPDLIQAINLCPDRLLAQGDTNAEEIALTCEKFIGDISKLSPNLRVALLQTLAQCQNSRSENVLVACSYLKFVLGTENTVAKLLGTSGAEVDDEMKDRMLQHISFSNVATKEQLDFLIQHSRQLVFDPTYGRWKFPEPLPGRPIATGGALPSTNSSQ